MGKGPEVGISTGVPQRQRFPPEESTEEEGKTNWMSGADTGYKGPEGQTGE